MNFISKIRSSESIHEIYEIAENAAIKFSFEMGSEIKSASDLEAWASFIQDELKQPRNRHQEFDQQEKIENDAREFTEILRFAAHKISVLK